MATYSDSDIMSGNVQFPIEGRPGIQWEHIDGPLLYFSDGQLHWLTWRERFRCWMNWEDAETLQRKLRPRFCACLDYARSFPR